MSLHPAAGWVAPEAPPERLDAGLVVLARVRARHAPGVLEAINASIDELRPWMPWAQAPATAESVAAFVGECSARWSARTDFNFVLLDGDRTVGGCGLHARRGPGVLEIGYWVRTGDTGRGVATAASGALLAAAGVMQDIDRVEIRCDAGNGPSAAVARRCGLHLDGRLAQVPAAPGETGEHLVFAVDMAERRLAALPGWSA